MALADLQAELRAVRADIAAARQSSSVSVGGRSLAHQRLDDLLRREQQLCLAIQRNLRGGRPLGSTVVRF